MLTSTDDVKFLGVHIDSQLNWKVHVRKLASKISSFNYALRVITNTVNLDASICAYYAYVNSNLKYGIIFWGNSVDVGRIFVLQKSCVRSIFNLKKADSCKTVFKNNQILTV